MPITFTNERLLDYGKNLCNLEIKDDELIVDYRARVAAMAMKNDPVEGWEIKTGRPWDKWTLADTQSFVSRFTDYAMRNPGMLSMMKKHGLI